MVTFADFQAGIGLSSISVVPLVSFGPLITDIQCLTCMSVINMTHFKEGSNLEFLDRNYQIFGRSYQMSKMFMNLDFKSPPGKHFCHNRHAPADFWSKFEVKNTISKSKNSLSMIACTESFSLKLDFTDPGRLWPNRESKFCLKIASLKGFTATENMNLSYEISVKWLTLNADNYISHETGKAQRIIHLLFFSYLLNFCIRLIVLVLIYCRLYVTLWSLDDKTMTSDATNLFELLDLKLRNKV